MILSPAQITKLASTIEPAKLAEAQLVISILTKEAAAPGSGHVALIRQKLAFFDAAPAKQWLSDTWKQVGPNVLGGLAGGAVMGGLGYGMADQIPGESPEEFKSRRRRFALTAGLGGAAVGAATPTVLKATGMDEKISKGWDELTATPAERAQKAQVDATTREAAIQDKALEAAGATTALGATAGAIKSLHKTDEHFDKKQNIFDKKTVGMEKQRTELERQATDRGNQIKAQHDTAKHIGAADSLQKQIAAAQAELDKALKNRQPNAAQQQQIQQLRQRVGSLTGHLNGGVSDAATRARAIESWLAGKTNTVPGVVARGDRKFMERTQGQVGKLTNTLVNRGTGPSRAGVQAARTTKNTALGGVLGYFFPHLWDMGSKAVPNVTDVSPTLSAQQ